jgi:hypothetical protein
VEQEPKPAALVISALTLLATVVAVLWVCGAFRHP